MRVEGAQRAGVQLGEEVIGTTGSAQTSPLPLRAIIDACFRLLNVFCLGGVYGGFMLQALLTGETVQLCPKVQAHTCSTCNRRIEMVSEWKRQTQLTKSQTL